MCRGECRSETLGRWQNPMEDLPIVDHTQVTEVERALRNLKSTQDLWMLTIIEDYRSQPYSMNSTAKTIVGQPLLLSFFMSIQADSAAYLSPFTSCFSCIVELGTWAPMTYIESVEQEPLICPGSVRLVMPDDSKLLVRWESGLLIQRKQEEMEDQRNVRRFVR